MLADATYRFVERPIRTLGFREALRHGLFVWFYSGRDDPLRSQNEAFAAELRRNGVPHRYFEADGGHNWALWRAEAVPSFLAASEHIGG